MLKKIIGVTMKRNHNYYLLILQIIIGLFILNGCTTIHKANKDKKNGYILVAGNPQVCTRERLLRRRNREVMWLYDQLDKYKPTMQGTRDIREFSGLIGSISASLNPLKGQVDVATRNAELNQIESKTELNKLEQEIETIQLKNKIAKLKKEILNGTESKYTNSNESVQQIEIHDSSAEIMELLAAINKNNASDNNSTKAAVPEWNKSHKVGAEMLHPEDRFEMERAYRAKVYAAISEQELDDSHDLQGGSLLNFKFLATLLTGAPTDSFAKMTFSIASTNTISTKKATDLHRQWLSAFSEQMQEEFLNNELIRNNKASDIHAEVRNKILLERAKRQTVKSVNNILSNTRKIINKQPKENITKPPTPNLKTFVDKALNSRDIDKKKDFVNSAMQLLSGDKNNKNEFQTIQSNLNEASRDLGTASNYQTTQNKPETSYSPADYILLFMAKYQPLTDFFDYSTDAVVNLEVPYNFQVTLPVIDIEMSITNSVTSNKWYDAIADLSSNNSCWVYSVEPNYQAQLISDVAASENLQNLMLSVSAIIPQLGGLGVAGTLDHIRRSQARLQTLQRVPRTVGFVSSNQDRTNTTSFGWVVGPQFDISDDGKDIVFEHTPITHQLQATLVIPSWWNEVTFEINKEWIDSKTGIPLNLHKTRDGTTWCPILGDLFGLFCNSVISREHYSDEIRIGTEQIVVKNISPDYKALTHALLEKTGCPRERPNILIDRLKIEDKNVYYLNPSEQSQNLVIRGKELWRDPEVYVGNQKADKVEIHPDMDGITAIFDDFKNLTYYKNNAYNLDLTVITSAGSTTLRNVVSVGTPSKPASDNIANIFGHFTSAYVEQKIPMIKAIINPENIPIGWHSTRLVLQEKKGDYLYKNWKLENDLKYSPSLEERKIYITLGTSDSNKIDDIFSQSRLIKPTWQLQLVKDGDWQTINENPTPIPFFKNDDWLSATISENSYIMLDNTNNVTKFLFIIKLNEALLHEKALGISALKKAYISLEQDEIKIPLKYSKESWRINEPADLDTLKNHLLIAPKLNADNICNFDIHVCDKIISVSGKIKLIKK